MSARRLDAPPSTLAAYARAVAGSIPGVGSLPLVAGREDDVPGDVLELECAADPARVAAYCRVCEFTLRDTLPPTYPHVLAFPLHMALITDRRFPFPAMGIVHLANSITQRRPIGIGETLELSVRGTPLEPHPKGRQFSILTEARSGGELVWEATMTALRRGEATGEAPPAPELPDPMALGAAAEWVVPADIGRRYAAVSGDRNPIHLYGLTAKAFGFPRAIAHGMWTKARALAALEAATPDAFTVDVRFLRPVLLPARVTFAVEADGGRVDFGVRDERKKTPHLTGRLREG